MATYADLRLRILRILGDPEGTGYDNALLLDAIRAALDAILPWRPKTSVATLVANGTDTIFTLPADLYEVEAVVDDENTVIPGARLTPGKQVSPENNWLETPYGSISFEEAPTANYTLHYLAYWTKPSTDGDLGNTLEPPAYTEHGLALYAASYALYPAATSASEIRQFNTRIDSGAPEQNPMQKTALFLLQAFDREMNRHPKHMKASK